MGFNPLTATTRRPGSSEGGRGIVRITFKSSSLGNEPLLVVRLIPMKYYIQIILLNFFQVRNGKDGESPTIDVKNRK